MIDRTGVSRVDRDRLLLQIVYFSASMICDINSAAAITATSGFFSIILSNNNVINAESTESST